MYFNEIIQFLDDYEKDDMGERAIIHGDTVFTNILINKYDKIKFIDMRGKLDTLSILGDIHYDWAKVYQSLVGYDAILLEKDSTICNKYTERMIISFKDWYISKYSVKRFNWLKIITKSLIFSLIPIHYPENRDKCNKYFQLLNSKYLL